MRIFLTLVVSFLFSISGVAQQKIPSNIERGIDLYQKGEYALAISEFEKALTTGEKTADSSLIQTANTNLGNTYSITGKIEAALDHYQKAASIAERRQDPAGLAKITKNIGTLYTDQKELDKALIQFDRAQKIAESISAEDIIADCKINRAIVFELQEHYPEAIELYKQALHYYEQHQMEERMALTYNNLGIVYKQTGNLNESYYYYNKTYEIAERLDDKFIMAATLTNMANVQMLRGNYDTSLKLNNEALEISKHINALGIIKDVYANVSELYALKGDFKNAYLRLQQSNVVNDSLINIERSAQLTEMREKYETEKKEAENTGLRQEAEIKSLQIQEQALRIERRNLLLAASFLFIALAALAVFLYLKWQKGKNLRAREEAVRQSEEQQRIRFARDLHDDLGAGLSRLRMVSALTLTKTTDPSLKNDIRSLSATAGDLVSNMRDMLWAMNPNHTTVEYLISRIREHLYAYFENLPIRVGITTPSPLPDIKITAEQNRNIFLIAKEAFQNIIKHSGASEVKVVITMDGNIIHLEISDNGSGIADTAGEGNGMTNMASRAAQIGGNLKTENLPQGGLKLELTVKLDNTL